MKSASRILDTPSRDIGAKHAWSVFWQEPGQSRCVAGAADIWQVLTSHWAPFARSTMRGARVLDLGCGAGAVARELLSARDDLQVTGIDFARIPLTIHPQMELLAETAMESLPFAARSFGAVVSQFGFEYGQTEAAAQELARVLAPGGRISFLVHHAESNIVAHNRLRLRALEGFLLPAMRAAFCAGDEPAFVAQMSALVAMHPRDALIAELARSLPSRLGRASRERQAIWTAIEDALAPERCLANSLNTCCVTEAQMGQWLEPLQGACELRPPTLLRDPDGHPIAWKVEGEKKPS